MKKLSASFLLLLLVFCSGSFYLAFFFSMKSIKHSQQKIILSSSLLKEQFIHHFSFSKSEMDHIDLEFEGEKEISYNGKMFDIVHLQKTNDSIFVECISDEAEDFLFALRNDQQINQKTRESNQTLSDIVLRLGSYLKTEPFKLFSRTAYFPKYFVAKIDNAYNQPFLSIISPPPRLSFALS